MNRSRASAKTAGTRLETAIAGYLASHVDDRIERRAPNGAKDRGDLSGLRTYGGHRLVVEVKNYGGRLQPAQWMGQAQLEAGNDDASAAVVIAKRRGTAAPGEQWVLCTVDDLVVLLTGSRPDLGDDPKGDHPDPSEPSGHRPAHHLEWSGSA